MNPNQSLRSTLQALKDEAPPSTPLLSESDVRSLLQSPPPPTAQPTSIPWIITGSLAAAATVATIALWPDAPEPLTPPAASHAAAERGNVTDAHTPPAIPANKTVPLPAPATASADESNGSAMTIPTMELSRAELQRLGLDVQGDRIRYRQNEDIVTIRTNGIGARRHDSPEDGPVPPYARMVQLYHGNDIHASWWNKDDAERRDAVQQTKTTRLVTSVNDMIGIRIPLTPDARTYAVLWFDAAAVADPHRPLLPSRYTKAVDDFTQRQTTTLFGAATISPNPLTSGTAMLNLDLRSDLTTSAIVVDMNGREIATLWNARSMQRGQHRIPITGLDDAAAGMYLVVIQADGRADRMIQRLLIQR
ncbi:MAG: T9SS type A sorting domain-containing protein ['Candidatus Kapabacteria' thiocyanatum]|uniref:Secretion system C-terminal sorting domain-containing protein n=1 Tax=Candidatus Kapaibacterium thiocyanatum TaxID=1895771 RepID=A0A1M3KXF6_9BACT|nr:T9SS type A sorting domain-containing protein ['Candidatus Kapabacteria' thiocyanatum]OJX57067.1 MAG: hypothetical protein BGO89_11190 ['Candidatus Kapabacteria' thiocyanatum]